MTIESNPAKTAERVARLEVYARRHLLADGKFLCRHYAQCSASRRPPRYEFNEGQLSHIGRHYDLVVDGRETRIVVVGQEYASDRPLVELGKRSTQIEASGRGGWRHRNPHMRGTTSILRCFLGREPGTDRAGERLFIGTPDAHLFDGFALVNRLFCSAIGMESRKGRSSKVMQRNCSRHFVATLKVLEPTVLVIQGKGVRSWMTADGIGLALARSALVETVEIGGTKTDVLTFVHPSALGGYGCWGRSHRSKYLRKTVMPSIREWRSRLTGGQNSDGSSGGDGGACPGLSCSETPWRRRCHAVTWLAGFVY